MGFCTLTDVASKNNPRIYKSLTFLFLALTVALGCLHVWIARDYVNIDGISYIEIAEAYSHGRWQAALNAYWSPLYSWILAGMLILFKPELGDELFWVHATNGVVYICACAAFSFMLGEWLGVRRVACSDVLRVEGRSTQFSDLFCTAYAFTLFLWISLELITVWIVTPDLCVSVFVYMAAGILLRHMRKPGGTMHAAGLGLMLGCAYLTKAAMLPISFLFLMAYAGPLKGCKAKIKQTAIALGFFLIVATPFTMALVVKEGPSAFNKQAQLNYAWHVNQVDRNFAALIHGHSSTLLTNPPRVLLERPTVYEFATPIEGSNPIWREPAYWYEGVRSHVDLKRHGQIVQKYARKLMRKFLDVQTGLPIGLLVVSLAFHRRALFWRDLKRFWPLWVPALGAVCMYACIYIEARYIGCFILLLGLSVIFGARFSDTEKSKRYFFWVGLLVIALFFSSVLSESISFARYEMEKRAKPGGFTPAHTQAAEELKRMGLLPGDYVGAAGDTFLTYWARLAGVKIVAKLPREELSYFEQGDDRVKERVLEAFRKMGAKILILEAKEGYVPSEAWTRIGDTMYYYVKL